MADNHSFLAFDCGATSGRAVLATFSNHSFEMKEVYRFPSGIICLGGKYYWDILAIYQHFLNCLKDLGRQGIVPDSIGIDTWGVDFGFVADDGSLLGNPRAYRDPYTEGIPEKVFETIPREELYGATGIQIMNFNSIFQLYAQTGEGFAPLRYASHILFMPDLLSYMLTGKQVCEYTIASTSGMMDQGTRQFNKALLEKLGIRTDVLLPIVQPGEVIGTLRKGIADSCGLPQIPVVSVAGHDTASAVAAVPATHGRFAYLSSGTWSLMGIETQMPVLSSEAAHANIPNEGGVFGTTRFLKNITGMWIVENLLKEWAAEGTRYGYDDLPGLCDRTEPFSCFIDPDDPSFNHPASMQAAIYDFCDRTGQARPANHAACIRTVFQSLAMRYREVLQQITQISGQPVDMLHIIGGGSKNRLLNRFTANATGKTVVAGPSEATAIGNVMLQAYAAGLVPDLPRMRSLIAASVPVEIYTPGNTTAWYKGYQHYLRLLR